MATIMQSAADRRSAERRFYTRMAWLLVALVFLGFAPSFYLYNMFSYPRPNPTLTPSVLAHGMLFTAWMLVFIAQTQLVAAGRTDLHIRLGKASMVLALAIIPAMYLVSVWQVARANQPPFTDPLNWTAIPLFSIPAYALLVWTGWKRRREAQWHKRMMLGAAILVVMGPALGRLPLAPPTLPGFTFQMLFGLVLFVPLIVHDRRRLGHVHAATQLAFGVAAASVVVPLLLIATGSWAPVAQHLPGVGR